MKQLLLCLLLLSTKIFTAERSVIDQLNRCFRFRNASFSKISVSTVSRFRNTQECHKTLFMISLFQLCYFID